MKKARMGIVIILVIFISTILCSQTVFCEYGMWEGLTCFGYLVHPPKDLYDYKVLSPISFTDNEIEEFEFQNKYLGMHDVGIILENYSNEEIFGAMRDLKVYLQINFYIKDKILSSY